MQLTILGIGFISLALAVTLYARSWLPAVIVLSAVFQGSSVLDVSVGKGAYGVTPYNFSALLAAIVLLFRLTRARTINLVPKAPRTTVALLFAYAALSALGAFFLPPIFEGLSVNLLIERAALDQAPSPLRFTLANLAQAVNLGIHMIVLLFLIEASTRPDWNENRLILALGSGAFLMLAIGAYERVADTFDLQSTIEFWTNNPGYLQHGRGRVNGLLRMAAPMSEASYASSFLATVLAGLAAVIAFGAKRAARRDWALAVGFTMTALALINTLGATGWVVAGLSCAAIFLALFISVIREPSGVVNPRRQRTKIIGIATIAALLFAGWLGKESPSAPFVTRMLDNLLISKLESASAKVRRISNQRALTIVKETHGLGVGLGSNRASSFLASLVSNTGIAGALLFLGMLGSIFWRYLRAPQLSDAQIFVGAALATATLAMSLAIPDLNLPIYWVFIFLGILFCPPSPKAAIDAESTVRE